MTINEFCGDVERALNAMTKSEANEVIAAIIEAVDPPSRPHASDCATSRAPAHMPSWCDCGATITKHDVADRLLEIVAFKSIETELGLTQEECALLNRAARLLKGESENIRDNGVLNNN